MPRTCSVIALAIIWTLSLLLPAIGVLLPAVYLLCDWLVLTSLARALVLVLVLG